MAPWRLFPPVHYTHLWPVRSAIEILGSAIWAGSLALQKGMRNVPVCLYWEVVPRSRSIEIRSTCCAEKHVSGLLPGEKMDNVQCASRNGVEGGTGLTLGNTTGTRTWLLFGSVRRASSRTVIGQLSDARQSRFAKCAAATRPKAVSDEAAKSTHHA